MPGNEAAGLQLASMQAQSQTMRSKTSTSDMKQVMLSIDRNRGPLCMIG